MKVRDEFAYPFKVLRDVFTVSTFVPDPEFKRFDLEGFRTKIRKVTLTRKRGIERIRISALLLLLVAVVIALIIVG